MNEFPTADNNFVPIGDIASISRGTINPNKTPLEVFNYYSIPGYDSTGGPSRTPGKEIQSNKTILESRCVLISKLNPRIPRVCIANTKDDAKTICSTEFIPLVPRNRGIDLEYIAHYLRSPSFQEKFQAAAGGSTNSHSRVTPNEILDWEIFVPPLPEQKKIAEILSGIDKAIALKQKAVENLKSTREAVCNELILMGAGKHEEPVGSVTTHMTNGFVGTATPYYRKHGVRYLTSKNIRSDRIDPRNMVFVSDEFHASNQKSALKSGDVLMVQSGHIGTTAVVPEEYKDCNCHALILMRFESEKIDPHFASVYFNSTEGKRRLSDIFVGSTIKHVNTGDLKKFRIPVPSLETQKDIASKMKAMDMLLEVKQQEIDKQIALKKAISMDLLSGRKRVSV